MIEIRDYYTGGLKNSCYTKAFGISPQLIRPSKKKRAEDIFGLEKQMDD